MSLSSLCGFLPSAPEKKTFRQRLLEFAGRYWSLWAEILHGMLHFTKTARNLYGSVTGFWGRFYSLIGVVLTATLFNISPFGTFKLLSAVSFLVFSEAMFVTSYPSFWRGTVIWFRTMSKLSRRKGLEWKPLTPGMKDIARRMGMKIDKIGVMDGLHNAVSLPVFNRIIIGRPLYDSLDEKALEAVFAHELAHVKEKHNLVPLIAIPVILSQLLIWLNLPVQLFVIAALAFSRLAFIPFNWIVELRADQVGGGYAGRDNMIHALQSLDGARMDEPSESHPSLRRRIRRLEEGPVPGKWYLVVGLLIIAGAILPWILGMI